MNVMVEVLEYKHHTLSKYLNLGFNACALFSLIGGLLSVALWYSWTTELGKPPAPPYPTGYLAAPPYPVVLQNLVGLGILTFYVGICLLFLFMGQMLRYAASIAEGTSRRGP